MQNAALIACGIEMRYARFQIGAEELARAFELVRALNFVGVNLTIPHKITGMQLVGSVDGFAKSVGAINTVRFDRSESFGSNTDGPGFAAAVWHDFGIALRGLRVVVLGCGGAGRAIAMQCARDGCKRLTLVNRTTARGQQLAADSSLFYGTAVEAIPWSDDAVRSAITGADLLVNATSIGLHPADPPVVPRDSLHSGLFVYDTVYGAAPTALLVAARAAGARSANGLSMLLHQGALAFEAWFGRAAPVCEMAAALRAD